MNLSAHKTRRLLEVRDEEKRLAAQRCASFRKYASHSLQTLATELKIEWEAEQRDRVKKLEAKFVDEAASFGLSHTSAEGRVADQSQKMFSIRNQLLVDNAAERIRCKRAGERIIKEEYELFESARSRSTIRTRVKQEEKERAKRAAALGKKIGTKSDLLSAALPHSLCDILAENQRGFNSGDFSNSIHHRDFAVVKATSLPKPLAADAVAAIVAEQHGTYIAEKQMAVRSRHDMALARYVTAISGRVMDQSKVQLCTALDELRKADRRRKHENAVQFSEYNRISFVNSSSYLTESEFLKSFSFDRNNAYSTDRVKRGPPSSPSISLAV